jgi:hypothetical protein
VCYRPKVIHIEVEEEREVRVWVEAEFDYSESATSEGSWVSQFGQYQGAGVFTGLGLRLRHLAQR